MRFLVAAYHSCSRQATIGKIQGAARKMSCALRSLSTEQSLLLCCCRRSADNSLRLDQRRHVHDEHHRHEYQGVRSGAAPGHAPHVPAPSPPVPYVLYLRSIALGGRGQAGRFSRITRRDETTGHRAVVGGCRHPASQTAHPSPGRAGRQDRGHDHRPLRGLDPVDYAGRPSTARNAGRPRTAFGRLPGRPRRRRQRCLRVCGR